MSEEAQYREMEHAAALVRINELEDTLTAERKRRERAEDCLYEEQQAHTAALVSAETAERERNDLSKEHEEDQGVIRVWRGRCERAEADNAALLQALLDVADLRPSGPTLDAMVTRLHAEPHPGAALLERVRTLEEGVGKIAADVGEWAHTEDCDHDDDDAESPPCECGKGELLSLLATLKATD